VVQGCHDNASRFVYILTKGKRRYLVEDDFTELIQVSNVSTGIQRETCRGCSVVPGTWVRDFVALKDVGLQSGAAIVLCVLASLTELLLVCL